MYRPVYVYLVVRDMPADLDTLWLHTEPADYRQWWVPAQPVRLEVRPGTSEHALGAVPRRLSGTYLGVAPPRTSS